MKNLHTGIAITIALLVGLGAFWFTGMLSGQISPDEESRQEANLGSLTQTGIDAVQVSVDTRVGQYLTDARGRTLYTTTRSSCTDACLAVWPAYTTLDADLEEHPKLETRNRADVSGDQYVWDGKPLYYYENDTQVGDIEGHGVGDVWFVAKP